MTVRDPEILEVLRDEPELLALADAVAETQRPPKRSRLHRTAPRAFAGAFLVAAAVLIVFLVVPGGGGHGIVDRALAAIGNGRVLHLVTESPTGRVLVDLKSGRRTVELFRDEIWYDRDTKKFHLVMRLNGEEADLLLPDDAQGATMAGGPDPAFTALWLGYRQALASGEATVEREGRVDGRPVYWLRFKPFQPDRPGTLVAIDQHTYKPVRFREYYRKTRYVEARVLVAETIGFHASDFRRRGQKLFAGKTVSGGSSMDLPPPKHPTVKPPWLTPGNRVAGLKLSAVNPMTRTTRRRTIHGVELVYGNVNARPFALTIEQLPRADDPRLWRHIPPGSVLIERGEAGDGRTSHTQWTGSVVRYGIYVEISTRLGERAVVAIARALHPAP
jgi:hypothetical protein